MIFLLSNDTDAESELVIKAALAAGADAAVPCTLWAEGGLGAIELGKAVIQACSEPNPFKFLYELDLPIKEKIEIIAREMYGAKDCSYTPEAEEQIATITKQGFSALPICMAKTHLSLSADPKAKGAPTGFTIPISVVKMSAGAGFIYPVRRLPLPSYVDSLSSLFRLQLVGTMSTMPGLSTRPGFFDHQLLDDGEIIGLS